FSFGVVLFLYLLIKKAPTKTIVQLSPLPVGFIAVLATQIKRKKIVVNISDLWPKAGLEMGLLKPGLYYRILEKMERFCYAKSCLILGQSQEILTHAARIVPEKNVLLYRNLNPHPTSVDVRPKHRANIRLFYAGLIGVAQGFAHLLPQIKLPKNIELHLFGDGPEKIAVATQVQKIPRCFYHGSLSKIELYKRIVAFDAAFVPLRQRIYGSVPSKIFEYSAMGMPILYFSEGEGADLVSKHYLGICTSSMDALNTILKQLSEEKIKFPNKAEVYKNAQQAFDFDAQIRLLIKQLKRL
ncbi:MAG: glycosyltransferase, partial [Flavobacteriaceae bacterium]|nr:glycosyltransferase [Flavobacteriaceae bacterium]